MQPRDLPDSAGRPTSVVAVPGVLHAPLVRLVDTARVRVEVRVVSGSTKSVRRRAHAPVPLTEVEPVPAVAATSLATRAPSTGAVVSTRTVVETAVARPTVLVPVCV